MNQKHIVESWVGKSVIITDVICAKKADHMRCLFPGVDSLDFGDALPPLWHWAYFIDPAPMSEIDLDGHPKRDVGQFLPPIHLEQRMWAGGRLHYSGTLCVGDEIKKTSTITEINFKEGGTGELCFVTVDHQYSKNGSCVLREEQDIVYKNVSNVARPRVVQKEEAECQTNVLPDPVMLFRYSALTFNSHRIHYDIDYCKDVEGYPALVVHGPLTATLLAQFASKQRKGQIMEFSFRGLAPLFAGSSIALNYCSQGDRCLLWANGPEGAVGMQAEGRFQ